MKTDECDILDIDLDRILDDVDCSFLANGERVKVKLAMVTAIRQSLETASTNAIEDWKKICEEEGYKCNIRVIRNFVKDTILNTIHSINMK